VVQEGDDMQGSGGLEWSVAARGSGGAEWSVAEEVSLPYLPDYHTQHF
jgi:hypothetical protein